MPVVPIREEIHVEINDDQLSEEIIFPHTSVNADDEEIERVQLDDNEVTVDESGAIVRPVIALWDDMDSHGKLDVESMVQDSGSMFSAAVAIRND